MNIHVSTGALGLSVNQYWRTSWHRQPPPLSLRYNTVEKPVGAIFFLPIGLFTFARARRKEE